MNRLLIATVAGVAMNLIALRAYVRALQLRSRYAFALLYLAVTALNICAVSDPDSVFVLGGIRVYLLNPLALFVAPILFSSGPLHARVTRTFLIVVMTVASECLCAATFMALGHDNTLAAVADPANLRDVILTYSIGMLSFAISSELLIMDCERRDATVGPSYRRPLIAFLVASLLFLWWNSIQAIYRNGSPTGALVCYLCALCSVVCAYTLLWAARRDVEFDLRQAERDARARQRRRVVHEVEELARRARALGRLRHDLANQMQVVMELAAAGHAQEAARYLDALQDQARRLAEGDDA